MPLLMLTATPATAAAQQSTVLPERERILTSEPTQVYSVGKEEGESWELLASVVSTAFDENDNLYVMDAGNHRVLVFDPAGRFLRQIGKQGQGPGELMAPLGMVVGVNGDVIVADAGRGGYTIYGADGGYKETVIATSEGRMFMATGFQASPLGGIVARSMPTVTRSAQGVQAGSGKSPVMHHPLAGEREPTTLYEIDIPPPRVTEQGNQQNRRVVMVLSAPPIFTPNVSWGVLPTGSIAVNNSARYAIQIIDPHGSVQRIIRRDEEPRRVTHRDREAGRERQREQMQNPRNAVRVTNQGGRMGFSRGGGGMTEQQIEERLRDIEFADVMPLVQGLTTDVHGRIWVHRTGERAVGPGPIDLLDADGRYIGTLRGAALPDAVSASGLAAFIERDELDIERVVVRKLPADWR